MGCSSLREYQHAPPWSSQQTAVWTSALLWSSAWTIEKYLLHCDICSRPGEAVEVTEHKVSECAPGCAPLLGATVGVVDTSEISGFN